MLNAEAAQKEKKAPTEQGANVEEPPVRQSYIVDTIYLDAELPEAFQPSAKESENSEKSTFRKFLDKYILFTTEQETGKPTPSFKLFFQLNIFDYEAFAHGKSFSLAAFSSFHEIYHAQNYNPNKFANETYKEDKTQFNIIKGAYNGLTENSNPKVKSKLLPFNQRLLAKLTIALYFILYFFGVPHTIPDINVKITGNLPTRLWLKFIGWNEKWDDDYKAKRLSWLRSRGWNYFKIPFFITWHLFEMLHITAHNIIKLPEAILKLIEELTFAAGSKLYNLVHSKNIFIYTPAYFFIGAFLFPIHVSAKLLRWIYRPFCDPKGAFDAAWESGKHWGGIPGTLVSFILTPVSILLSIGEYTTLFIFTLGTLAAIKALAVLGGTIKSGVWAFNHIPVLGSALSDGGAVAVNVVGNALGTLMTSTIATAIVTNTVKMVLYALRGLTKLAVSGVTWLSRKPDVNKVANQGEKEERVSDKALTPALESPDEDSKKTLGSPHQIFDDVPDIVLGYGKNTTDEVDLTKVQERNSGAAKEVEDLMVKGTADTLDAAQPNTALEQPTPEAVAENPPKNDTGSPRVYGVLW